MNNKKYVSYKTYFLVNQIILIIVLKIFTKEIRVILSIINKKLKYIINFTKLKDKI